MDRQRNKLLLIGLTLLLVIEGARQSMAWAAESPKTGTLSVVLENDAFHGTDRHYTNGLMLIWVPGRDAPTPEWAITMARLMMCSSEQCEIRHGYAFGQSMFTPSDIDIANPPLWDRPYAGWLYGAIGVGVETGRQLDQFWITFGMVGPASLAEQTQKFAHRVLPGNEPQGWDTQLDNEPGIVATYQRSWLGVATASLSGGELDFTPHIGGRLATCTPTLMRV